MTRPLYHVRIAPRPIVIDAAGCPLLHARVLEISFPSDTIDTPQGRMTALVGAGVAKIMVGSDIIRGVPLC